MPRVKLKPLTEAQFTAQVIQLARLRGFWVAHFRPARVLRGGREKYETPVAADGKGFPDLLLSRHRDGRLLVAELKVGRRKATPEQSAWLAGFEAAGVPAHVWTPDSWDEIERVLE